MQALHITLGYNQRALQEADDTLKGDSPVVPKPVLLLVLDGIRPDVLHAATLFETLHDRGIDGACVNFPIRRGPHEHPVRIKTIRGYSRGGRYLGTSVYGPKEYYLG